MNLVKSVFKLLAGNSCTTQIKQAQVIVRTAGNEIESPLHKSVGKSLCVFDNSLLILFKLRLKSFAEANCLTGNYVHKRSALCAREHSGVELLCKIFVIAKDKSAAGSAQSFMSSCGNNIGIRDWRLMKSGGNKTGNMSHIHHKHCAVSVSNVSHFLKINLSRIS